MSKLVGEPPLRPLPRFPPMPAGGTAAAPPPPIELPERLGRPSMSRSSTDRLASLVPLGLYYYKNKNHLYCLANLS